MTSPRQIAFGGNLKGVVGSDFKIQKSKNRPTEPTAIKKTMASTSDVLLRSVSLNTPGQTVDIQCDGNHSAERDDLLIGLSWDFYPGTKPVDLDASAVCFDSLGVVQDAVYFNQLTAFNGALKHSGDSTDGSGDGFDETIAFDVDKLPNNVHMVALVVNAHDEG